MSLSLHNSADVAAFARHPLWKSEFLNLKLGWQWNNQTAFLFRLRRLKGQHDVSERRLMLAAWKSDSCFDKQIPTVVSGHAGDIVGKSELTHGNKFRIKLKSLLPSYPKSRVGKPCCRWSVIGANKERSFDLINHCVWQQRTLREGLLLLSLCPAFIFTPSLFCLCWSLPLSHPFHQLYSLRLFISPLFPCNISSFSLYQQQYPSGVIPYVQALLKQEIITVRHP